jgi:hypothetical protein
MKNAKGAKQKTFARALRTPRHGIFYCIDTQQLALSQDDVSRLI